MAAGMGLAALASGYRKRHPNRRILPAIMEDGEIGCAIFNV
jgi:hypothetical protein